ncbi:flagellar protein FliS [Alicyclobacillus cycloheptanicus]|uniref:Flagellar biosynthetic protein FliS n=1 Tax=Alicyclobacillus cycloheptanicus TaxID=1457 RepID=A0ABT9XKK5_9BACL|nr:flagellar protein FliS [Alicyclobacillus cycloheptanicus]MDQ0190670.1 flagellar biosynthetic protein FliS [Alicyclobacillus cycloheptanicus]WDM00312.1 flagellar protein FliS [Alicyclobacillus cycloheptanicus]
MNPHDAYRRSSVYTTPLHVLLSQLHRQAGVFTRQAAEFAANGDTINARKHIQYTEDIIAFLRSSLDMSLEVSQKTDATYSYYYNILVQWFLDPSVVPDEYSAMLEFWDSWATTWAQASSAASNERAYIKIPHDSSPSPD